MNNDTTHAAKVIDWDAVERAIERQPWRPGAGADPDRGPYEVRDVQILTADERPADEAERLAIFDEANRRGYGIYNPRGGGMGVRQTRYPDTTHAHPTLPGWTYMAYGVTHPDNDLRGDLVRNDDTGIYRLDSAGALISVPQAWAEATARLSTVEAW